MNSTAEAATVQYRLSLSHALHAVSPALAALHTSRVAALHPELSSIVQPTHCPKCGTYRFSGDHPSCLVGPSTRKKGRAKSHAKVLYRRCHSCFALTSPSPDHPSAPTQPPSGSSRTGTTPIVPQTKGIRREPPPSELVTVRATKIPPKSSHTKTSTLKHMLCRDRQREEDARSKEKRKEGHEGLAAFLKEL